DVTGAPIGSVVQVYEAGGLGQPDRLLGARPVVANTGYGSGALTDAWFGLGGGTTADVRIVRPFGAAPVDLPGVAADRAVPGTAAGGWARAAMPRTTSKTPATYPPCTAPGGPS